MNVSFSLSTIDWTALASIATALAAVASAFAAWGAFKASKTALDIDGRQARREEERTKRTALAMVVPLMHELYLVETKINAALGLADETSDQVAKLSILYQMIDRMNIPLLEKFVDRFSAFEEETASTLGNALSVVLQMKMSPPLDLSNQIAVDMQRLPDNVQATIEELRNTLSHVLAAKRALQPHFERVSWISRAK
jgi:hypothetical protein